MKKIRILFIFMALFLFLVGCEKNYTLKVYDDKIVEEFDLKVPNNKDNKELLDIDYYPLHANDKVLYTKTVKKNGKYLDAHFEYTYEPEEFSNANSVNECFANKEIIVDNNEYYFIKLKDVKECMTDYNFTINVITDNKVLENNADKVSGKKYIWYLDEENKDVFSLKIKISKDKKAENSNDFLKHIGVVFIVVVVIIAVTFVSIKRKKANDI